MVSIFLFLVGLLAVANGFVFNQGLQYEQGVNVTVSAGDSRFTFRVNEVTATDGIFVDVSVQGAGSATSDSQGGESGSFTANGIAAIGSINTYGAGGSGIFYPTLTVAFFNESGTIDVSTVASSLNVAASAAFVGKLLEKLEEIDGNGHVVNTIDLSNISYTTTGLQTADPTRGLQYVSYTATANGATIAITYSVSAVLGILNNGGAAITPTSVESFFEVDGYQYAQITNHLRLTLFIGQLSASETLTLNGTILSGSGATQIYVRLSETVIVNGVTESVTLSGLASTVDVDTIPSVEFKTQLTSAVTGSLSASVRQLTVDFPANAASFTYDPSIGFGDPGSSTSTDGGSGNTIPNPNKSVSTALIPAMTLIFACFLALLSAF